VHISQGAGKSGYAILKIIAPIKRSMMQKSSAFEFVMNGNAGWTPNLVAASDNIAVLNGAFDALYKPTVSVVYRNAKLIFCKLRRTITSAGLCSQHAKVSSGHGSRQPDDPFYDSQRSAT